MSRVLYRGAKGKKAPLVTTPFANNLSECLVFLDEAHCRGTDLKLPQNAQGALTLALGQTKDHTVQGKKLLTFDPKKYRKKPGLTRNSCNETASVGDDTVRGLLRPSRSRP